jgi:hypothetical protein
MGKTVCGLAAEQGCEGARRRRMRRWAELTDLTIRG